MAVPQAPRPPGSTYFEKKGEVHELRQLLRGAAADRDQQKKRDAIKKVIAYMTLGIDVSPLFSEMVMASATNDCVQKKMVYLYLTNYAESNSELAILAINTLQKDCRDDDPMIRGLALRSLCSLNLANMVEYLQPAVQRALEDVNGYVRKTAVIGVVKLYHIAKASVTETGIISTLKRLMSDSDAHVVANTIHAVEEVLADEGGLQPTQEMVTNLMNRLNQFSEWGQCAVLKLLTKYQVADEGEMFDIMNILDSLLKQSSSAVVLAITKIFLDVTSNRPDLQVEVLRRLKGPLLTLMAAPTPELAYTVLVHIQALCMRGGPSVDAFGPDFKQFFCRYHEPSYIKTVKIDILTMLADVNSSESIVAELSEYVTDVDAEISRRAIRAIGKIAVRVPSTVEMIVVSLTTLLELDTDYVSTEAAIVMKDLVRKYPHQFERASGAVERCMKIVTEAEGKCALLWILGEYGAMIKDAPYLLEPMIDGFLEEPNGAVRLEMLTATVKLFFLRPPECQKMLGRLLQKAIEESSHPDVRDRALLYYRLLEVSPEEAQRVICTPKDSVEEFQEEMDIDVKERIFEEFNTLSTVYKQPASKFVLSKAALPHLGVYKMRPPPAVGGNHDDPSSRDVEVNGHDDAPRPPPAPVDVFAGSADLLGESMDAPPTAAPPAAAKQSAPPMEDLLGIGDLLGGDSGGPSLLESSMPPQPQVFELAMGAAMEGNAFQELWGRLPLLEPQNRQMRGMTNAPLTIEAVTEALRLAHIYVIASGNIQPGNAMKFFFYAKQASGPAPAGALGCDVWFLTEMLMTPGGMVTCSLKAENAQPASFEGYTQRVWGALCNYVL
mmetsp:Transcript_120900/g.341896  ORF Transcript_120900/g.341896 Transcript_120900/m.341896 type:complete len:836 (-) Transcript_120900:237-2744(-)